MVNEQCGRRGCCVEVRNVSKHIKRVPVLKDITLTVREGEVLGLSGVNGSGKTMLMRVMLGLVHPTSGEVAIDGAVLGRDISFPPCAGALIEAPALLPFRSGFENVRLLTQVRGVVGEREIRQELERVGLDPCDRQPTRRYSLGMKQRLGIAMSVCERPHLLILDEPTNALDASGVQMVYETIARERERGTTIVLASHDAGLLESMCDRVIHLAEGHVDGVRVRNGERGGGSA